MEINSHSAAIGTKSIASSQPVSKEPSASDLASVTNNPNISLSEQGKLFQQLDDKSQKLENILRASMDPQQAATVENNFQKIDAILEKDQISDKDNKFLQKLSNEIDEIFESSIKNMNVSEKKSFDKLTAELEGIEKKLESIPEQELIDYQPQGQSSVGIEGGSIESVFPEINISSSDPKEKQSLKNLNTLTIAQLNKLSIIELKKLNSSQLNRLNATQLNKLDAAQLDKLSSANQAKLSASQQAKLS